VVRIVLLGLAAAAYPQLLAVVLVILALPGSRRLLLVCCGAGLITSVALNLGIFAVFRSRGTVAGVSESSLGAGAYLGIGAIAILIALLIGTAAGRGLLARGRALRAQDDSSEIASAPGGARAALAKLRARADVALNEGSLLVAGITGALLAAPGPFDFLAAGHLARDGRAWVEAVVAIVVFALLKFALIEIPSAAYLVDPDGTAARVGALSRWMQANKFLTTAAFVGVVGLVLVGRGVAALS
jgi:Sap, sulfolipid-1-addressing protein